MPPCRRRHPGAPTCTGRRSRAVGACVPPWRRSRRIHPSAGTQAMATFGVRYGRSISNLRSPTASHGRQRHSMPPTSQDRRRRRVRRHGSSRHWTLSVIACARWKTAWTACRTSASPKWQTVCNGSWKHIAKPWFGISAASWPRGMSGIWISCRPRHPCPSTAALAREIITARPPMRAPRLSRFCPRRRRHTPPSRAARAVAVVVRASWAAAPWAAASSAAPAAPSRLAAGPRCRRRCRWLAQWCSTGPRPTLVPPPCISPPAAGPPPEPRGLPGPWRPSPVVAAAGAPQCPHRRKRPQRPWRAT
mmetsp:Transcript_105968/g.306472  ORF Transcript_105968/g.306472 Transcript_105968/m.306472 type:complete len:305 (+) Transcript_105968:36-950(+)